MTRGENHALQDCNNRVKVRMQYHTWYVATEQAVTDVLGYCHTEAPSFDHLHFRVHKESCFPFIGEHFSEAFLLDYSILRNEFVRHSALSCEEDFQHHLSFSAVFLDLCGCW